jgi:hypothetical protein
MTNNDSVSCGTVVDVETGKTCGIVGCVREMFYFLLPNKQIIVPCPTCKEQLATGFKADGKQFRYATVASVRALAEFDIELVTGLEINAGHCSFRACNCKLEAGEEMVLRDGEEYRRLCNNDASALIIISTKAKEELALHESGVKKLGRRDLQTVERQAKLVPETMRAALKAIAALKEQARAKTEAAKQLARAQLGTASTSATKPEAKKPDKYEIPDTFAASQLDLVDDHDLDPAIFDQARVAAYFSTPKTRFLDELDKIPEGHAAIVRRNAAKATTAAASKSATESESVATVAMGSVTSDASAASPAS